MTICTFYENLDGGGGNEILSLWKKSWQYYGWNPIILTLNDAKQHSLYKEYRAICETFPTVNGQPYELYCFLRWLAIANFGGWHCDFDVINYGFTPVDYGNQTVSCRNNVLAGCTTYATKKTYNELVNEIFTYHIKETDIVLMEGQLKPHVSDMTILLQSKQPIDVYLPIEALYDVEYNDIPWETAKLIHFANGYLKGQRRIDVINNHSRTSIFNR